MFKFLYANELKELFTVYGSYYDLFTDDDCKIKCRNILEIYNKTYYKALEKPIDLFSSIPDSVFVMMNPGSSEPRELGYVEPRVNILDVPDKLKTLRMVFAKPDVTQYQVMRIMVKMGWDHVRVINLSDIREAKSVKFFKIVKEFGNKHSDIHTIFSNVRKFEREAVFRLKKKDSPVVIGWGKDKHLISLAEKAFYYLKDYNTKGLVSNEHSRLYLHPSPNIQKAKEEWLKKMYNILK